MSKARRILATAAAIAFIVAVGAFFTSVGAGSKTAALGVSATVNANCTITTTAVAFGATYDPVAGSDVEATGKVTVACTKGASATVALDDGQNSSHVAVTTRTMKDAGTNYLDYELYSDGGRTTIWNAANTVAYNAPSKDATDLTVYGRIPSGQDVPAGAYGDSVTATITY